MVALGAGVTGFKVGDRVAYAGSLGAYADTRNIEAKFLVSLPDAISYETGAAMMLKGLTAEYLLFRSYPVKPGDVVLVHAAAGGVGLILCQWARSARRDSDRHGRQRGQGEAGARGRRA